MSHTDRQTELATLGLERSVFPWPEDTRPTRLHARSDTGRRLAQKLSATSPWEEALAQGEVASTFLQGLWRARGGGGCATRRSECIGSDDGRRRTWKAVAWLKEERLRRKAVLQLRWAGVALGAVVGAVACGGRGGPSKVLRRTFRPRLGPLACARN
eukprot:9496595-Pyramimonas_sp.AAC.1